MNSQYLKAKKAFGLLRKRLLSQAAEELKDSEKYLAVVKNAVRPVIAGDKLKRERDVRNKDRLAARSSGSFGAKQSGRKSLQPKDAKIKTAVVGVAGIAKTGKSQHLHNLISQKTTKPAGPPAIRRSKNKSKKAKIA